MKKISLRGLLYIVVAALSATCTPRSTIFEPGPPIYEPTHASGFKIYEAGQGSRAIRITDPWQGAQGIEQWVFLAENGDPPPENFPGTVLRQPARRIICMSSSYVAFLSELGAADRIVGVSGADFITDPTVRARIATGDVADVGYDGALDYERLAALKPDLMLVYGVRSGGETGATGRLAEMGVPAHREQTSPKFLDMDKLLEFFRQNNCHISKSQIYKLTRTNKIPCRKIGKSLLFSKDEVTEWLENGKP